MPSINNHVLRTGSLYRVNKDIPTLSLKQGEQFLYTGQPEINYSDVTRPMVRNALYRTIGPIPAMGLEADQLFLYVGQEAVTPEMVYPLS